MAKAVFINKAMKDIYTFGKRVEYVSQKGKRVGQTLLKIDRTIPRDENDPIFIKKGESYWKWEFMTGPAHISKTRPRPSQLTQSSFLSTLYGIQESIQDFSCETAEDFEEAVENFKSELEGLRDETQEKLDNMPEQLQYAPTGELLQERIDDLESTISEFESIDVDFEFDEDEFEDACEEAYQEEFEEATETETPDKEEWKQNWLDEKKEES